MRRIVWRRIALAMWKFIWSCAYCLLCDFAGFLPRVATANIQLDSSTKSIGILRLMQFNPKSPVHIFGELRISTKNTVHVGDSFQAVDLGVPVLVGIPCSQRFSVEWWTELLRSGSTFQSIRWVQKSIKGILGSIWLCINHVSWLSTDWENLWKIDPSSVDVHHGVLSCVTV